MFHCQSNSKTTGNYPSPAILYFGASLTVSGRSPVGSALFPPSKKLSAVIYIPKQQSSQSRCSFQIFSLKLANKLNFPN